MLTGSACGWVMHSKKQFYGWCGFNGVKMLNMLKLIDADSRRNVSNPIKMCSTRNQIVFDHQFLFTLLKTW